LGEAAQALPALEKADVAESFSRAASHYDSVAQLQRDVGTELLGELEQLSTEPEHVLDLGSGTGYFHPHLRERFPRAAYTGLDLAEGMVTYAREHHPAAEQWLVADAEALPLAAGSVDLVFSSLALQWCYRPELLFAELGRVLRPGGRCVFTSLGPDTLKELRSAWAAVDEHQHVNRFLPSSELQQAADRVQGVSLRLRARPYRMEYRQVRELLNELKTLGAHNVNRDRPSGLTGRRALQGMLRAYEAFRQEDVLPASYEVYFGILEKS
jgi:malonyl-CoA O-methyltransferase